MVLENYLPPHYVELDIPNRYTVAIHTITVTDLSMTEEAYVYKDKGVNHFDGDFEHLVEIQATTTITGNYIAVWMLSNFIGSEFDHLIANHDLLEVFYWRAAGQTKIYLREFYNGGYYDASWNCVNGVTYYLKIKRDESVGANGTLYCYIYSDAARTNLLTTLTRTLNAKKDFQYIYGANSREAGLGGGALDGLIANLDLQEPVKPSSSSIVPIMKGLGLLYYKNPLLGILSKLRIPRFILKMVKIGI